MPTTSTAPFRVTEAFEREAGPRRYRLVEHTTDQTLRMRDTGSEHTNRGATGTVTITLPSNIGKGFFFDFTVQAAQAFRIDPGSGSAIYINGAKQTDDKYIEASSINDSVRLVRDDNGDWFAKYTTGSWSVEA